MEVGIADAVDELRKEIAEAMMRGEKQPLQFVLGEVELQLQVQRKGSLGGKVDLKWVVVSVGAQAQGELTHTHTIKLTLKPRQDGGHVVINDTAERPR